MFKYINLIKFQATKGEAIVESHDTKAETVRILTIVSDPGFNQKAQEMFNADGFEIHGAPNFRQGLKMTSDLRFDLAIIDYMTPEIDGFTFMSILKGAEKTKNIPSIIVSETFSDEVREEANHLGAVGCAETSISRSELSDLVYAAIEFRRKAMERKPRVVAVDDSPILRALYGQILKKHGFDYKLLDDPTKALEPMIEFKPDIVLMDQNMPGMTGLELTKLMQADPRFNSTRIIMVTSDQKKERLIEALESGVVDFMTKPFDEEVLLARMRVHINSKKLFDDLTNAYKQLQTLKNKLEQLSITDGLTGLHNHRFFYEFLGDEISRVQRYDEGLSILLMDIDHFKKFNDTYGHKAGDYVLTAVADAMTQSRRENDFIARYGGEEFAVILPDTGKDEAMKAGEMYRESIESKKVDIDGKSLNVTVSVGVAQWDESLSNDQFIVKADKALYVSKDQGRNRVTLG
jgi:diguanylate cyclase (GGDEF)-like protein